MGKMFFSFGILNFILHDLAQGKYFLWLNYKLLEKQVYNRSADNLQKSIINTKSNYEAKMGLNPNPKASHSINFYIHWIQIQSL